MGIRENSTRNVSAANKILNGNYIIGIDTASSKSKGAMVVAKHSDKGVEIVGVSHYSKHPWINKLRFKWRIWMLYIKYYRKVQCVKETNTAHYSTIKRKPCIVDGENIVDRELWVQ